MGFFIIIPFGVLAGWSIFRIHRWLRRGNFGPEWWRAFTILACGGLLLGVWFAFFAEYHVARIWLHGFPMPVAMASRQENGEWLNSRLPVAISWTATVTDLLCGVALSLAPIAIGAFFKENLGRRDADGKPRI